MYDTFLASLKAAEEEHDVDVSGLLATGLEMRRCPKCAVPIEKNEGCDSMDCG